MKDSLKTKGKNNVLVRNLIQQEELKQTLPVSNLLKMAIKRYQFDIVGWTGYCIDNKGLNQKALPVYHQKPLEDLRIRDRILLPLQTQSIKEVYDSKSHYIRHLNKEYFRDQAFYEAILKNPSKYKTDFEDNLLNEEIDKSAKKYLKTIKKRRIDEEALIIKAQFLGRRSAYLSSSGPTSWHEIEQCEAELTYFKKEVVNPIVKKLK